MFFMKQASPHPALAYVQILLRHFPGLPRRIQKMKQVNSPPVGKGKPYLWQDDWTTVLMAEAGVVPSSFESLVSARIRWGRAQVPLMYVDEILPAVMTWERTRSVYRFDQSLSHQLLETEATGSLPGHLLEHLPSMSLFVEAKLPPFPLSEGVCDEAYEVPCKGAWVSFRETEEGQKDLVLVPLLDCSELDPVLYSNSLEALVAQSLILPLRGGICPATSNASIQEYVDAGYGKGEVCWDMQFEGLHKKKTSWLSRFINLVLYLGSQEPDVERQSDPGASKKQRCSLPPRSANVPGPLKRWNVGFREGALWRAARDEAIRNQPVAPSAGAAGSGVSPPRPHWRNAHWHRYWVGASGTEERRLTVKWVAQTLVNAKHHHPENGDELPAVRRRVVP